MELTPTLLQIDLLLWVEYDTWDVNAMQDAAITESLDIAQFLLSVFALATSCND